MNKELEMPIFIEKKFDGFGERMASQRFFLNIHVIKWDFLA